MHARLGFLASALALVAVGLVSGPGLGCGGDDPAVDPDAGASSGGASGGASGGTASGGVSSGGTSGGSSGGAVDAGRIAYPSGSGSYGPSPDGGVLCAEATGWTRAAISEPTIAAGAPLGNVARAAGGVGGTDVTALFATPTGLALGRRDGAGAWSSEGVPLVGAGGASEGALALGSDGTVHVVYTREDVGHVGYAVRSSGGAWTTTTVRDRGKARIAAIAVESTGAPQVVVDGLGGPGHLEWFRGLPDGGFGAPEIAQRSENAVPNVGPSIQLGGAAAADAPLVCFAGTIDFSLGLGCVRRVSDGAWQEVIRSGGGGQTSGPPAVAVGDGGSVHLAWPALSFATVPVYALGRSEHAPLGDGGFALTAAESLESGRGQLQAVRIALDAAGAAHFAWQVIAPDGTAAAIKYARLAPDGTAVGAVVSCDARLRWDLVLGAKGPEILYRASSTGVGPLLTATPSP